MSAVHLPGQMPGPRVDYLKSTSATFHYAPTAAGGHARTRPEAARRAAGAAQVKHAAIPGAHPHPSWHIVMPS
eukprot:364409-Chlamydomonas_euryale.AAC.17